MLKIGIIGIAAVFFAVLEEMERLFEKWRDFSAFLLGKAQKGLKTQGKFCLQFTGESRILKARSGGKW